MLPIATREYQSRTISGVDPPDLYTKHVSRSKFIVISVSSFFRRDSAEKNERKNERSSNVYGEARLFENQMSVNK